MDIVYTSSNSYCEVLAVSLISLLESNKDIEALSLFLIENKIQDENIQALTELVHKYKREIKFIEMPNIEEKIGVSVNLKEVDLCTYSTCYLASILPENLDKVLYLDCDTLIRHPLHELWNTDITDYYLAGVDDVVNNWYRKALGMKRNIPYVNAGVLLINLKKWREENVENIFFTKLLSYNGQVTYMDQGVLNSVLSPSILLLHPRYNYMTMYVCFSYRMMLLYRRPASYCDEKTFYELQCDPTIVHFTNNVFIVSRPWLAGSEHPFTDEYLHHREMTFARNLPLQKYRKSKTKKIAYWLYHHCPKGLVAITTGVYHSWLSPMFDWVKGRKALLQYEKNNYTA